MTATKGRSMTGSTLLPLDARVQLMRSETLGAGTFFHEALRFSEEPDLPILYGNGDVGLNGSDIYSLSMNQIDSQLRKLAAGYVSVGVGSKSVVGVILQEGIQPLLHFLALSSLGAIPALINDAMAPSVAASYLGHIGAQGVVTDNPEELLGTLSSHVANTCEFVTRPQQIELLGSGKSATVPSDFPYRHSEHDVVALIHSSGTTGTPKSTTLAHRQFWRGKRIRLTRFPAESDDRLMSMMPHTHAGGLSYFLTAILLGLPMMAVSGWTREVVEPLMVKFRPTMVASFPRSFVQLATGPLPTDAAQQVHTWFNTGDGAHYAHIKRLVSLGHQPTGLTSPWLLTAERGLVPERSGSRFIDGLGSSEMGMALFGQLTTSESDRDLRCVGKPVSVVRRAAILDDDGDELPDGTVGLLGVQTTTRTPGYWNSPDLTRSFEAGSYWLTGDVAYRSSNGKFYHLDRTSDVIAGRSGAVYSLPIEEVILADCPELVVDCAVVGVWCPRDEAEAPIGVVRLTPEAAGCKVGYVLGEINKQLGASALAQLAAVVIASTDSEFPTGVTGKVLKRELRERHRALLGGVPT